MFTSVSSSNGPSETQILSLRVVAELRRIVAIMRGGDVVVVSIEEEDSPVLDFVGQVSESSDSFCRPK